MNKYMLAMASITLLASMSGVAHAKGCLKGAAVGGAAGHVAGKHGAVGAAAGCAIGHHKAAKREKETQAAQARTAEQRNPSHPATSGK